MIKKEAIRTLFTILLVYSIVFAQDYAVNNLAVNGTISGAGAAPAGALRIITTGSCGTGWTESTALNGKVILGTLAANGDVGTTGGSDTVTPTVATLTAAAQTFTGDVTAVGAETIAYPTNVPSFSGASGTVPAELFTGASGTVPAEVFSGSSATSSAVSAGTPAGTNGTVSFTPVGTNGTVTGPAQVISWPAGVPTNAAISAGTPAGTISALTTGADSSTTGGVAKAIAQTPTFTGSALGTHTHTISWPAGVPTNATNTIPAETFTGSAGTVPAETFTGSALGTHTHTLTATGTNGTVSFTPTGTNATVSFTPTGTIAWPANPPTATGVNITPLGHNATSNVTGTLSSFDNRSAYVKVIFCVKS